ncbi:MAG: transglutaminase domain-containing protein [Calditrichaeota bacterium]|nr:MAG: transglutaminase domain-containing protein [Calditrichota bacterium]
MTHQRQHYPRIIDVLLRLLPTLGMVAYLWSLTAASTAEFHISTGAGLAVFAGGMLLAYWLYSYRLRFSITFVILVGILWLGYKFIGNLGGGEFDAFYYSTMFLAYGVVLVLAWVVGFGFARLTYFPWIMAAGAFLFAMLFLFLGDVKGLQALISPSLARRTALEWFGEGSITHQWFVILWRHFAPVLLYCGYIVSIHEILRKWAIQQPRRWRSLMFRSATLLLILLLIVIAPILYVRWFGFPGVLQQRLQDTEVNSADFLKKTYNAATNRPEFDLREYAQLLPEVKLSDETVFCTYINNFFPLKTGGKIPIPVHFRRFVLNRYEPEKERFVLDPYPPSAIPNDLFSPSTRDVPVGFAIRDTIIESSTMLYLNRKNINCLVYLQSLSPDAYLAPNTGYFYQKLPVPEEDRETFHTAYQCSSLISIWNLPPFVYSSSLPELVEFRKMRAQALRRDRSYAGLDSTFLRYYTQVDTTDTLIMNLARRLTAGKTTPYDKVAAIIDYFFQTDENGNPVFTYTLKPGAPDDPNESMMHYFLKENKKGYCTYFAGATTLLLRAAGIPARLVVGYAIVDRSNKNTGWYWVYADQGHAWVEVYFPSYGWVDFDTTPTEDTEVTRPPKPDATPPQFAREPVFAVLGKVTGITADSTAILVRPYKLTFRSREYDLDDASTEVLTLAPKRAEVKIEGKVYRIGEFPLERTMVLSAYSTAYELEQLPQYRGRPEIAQWVKQRFPQPIPVDEAIIVYRDDTGESGKIFAVEGRVERLLPDSSGLTIIPRNIYYRGKNYPLKDVKPMPIHIRPVDGMIHIGKEKRPLREFAVGDSMVVSAESSQKILHQIRPYLATEPFQTWFRNSFPERIPVDRVMLEIEQTPVTTVIARWMVALLIGGAVLLLLSGMLVYAYISWRVGLSRDRRRLYWLYRFSLMVLNQLGFYRVLKTPLEFARENIDPQFGTRFGLFMEIYLKAKYAPPNLELTPQEQEFVEEFRREFKQRVLGSYSRWERMRNFVNFVRTLRFLFA